KFYCGLGGAVRDNELSSWSDKGWYDYVRPISALRCMAQRRQSSDPGLPHYSPLGRPLIPGYVELVQPGDPLAGSSNQNLYKIKARAWFGPDSISSAASDTAGVGWILGEKWWPYQRPTFVTPPFAGYISGQPTYSPAAAEVRAGPPGDAVSRGGMAAPSAAP